MTQDLHHKNRKEELMEGKNNSKKNNKKTYFLIGMGIVLLAVIIIAAIYLMNNKQNDDERIIAYTELLKEINEQNIEKIEMTVGSNSIKVKLKSEEKEKKAIVPNIQAYMELIQQKAEQGNEFELIQKEQSLFLKIPTVFLNLLPTILMAALFVMIFKMQGLGDKGKIYDGEENKSDVKFKDVAGLDEEKAELVEIVDFLK